jgi:predicted peptidase
MNYFGQLMICLAISFVADEAVVEQFTERQLDLPHADGALSTFRYRLHKPKYIDPQQRYPLLLWLHGARERGDDNTSQLRWMELVFETASPEDFDYYILAAQCPPGGGSWFTKLEFDQGFDMIDMALRMLEEVMNQEPIDRDRICVSGVSSGGTAAWETALRQPSRFAAVGPLSSSRCNMALIARLKGVPVWAFNSLRDDQPIKPIQAAVNALKSAGGTADLSLVDNSKHGIKGLLHEHDSWTAAFKQYDLMQWFLAQERGALFAPSPGIRPWKWWNYTVLLGPFVLCWLAWKSEKRKRARASMNSSRPVLSGETAT